MFWLYTRARLRWEDYFRKRQRKPDAWENLILNGANHSAAHTHDVSRTYIMDNGHGCEIILAVEY
jgi:DNA-directed RNA polymerase specialized sigma24 family protein